MYRIESEDYSIPDEPFYAPQGSEVRLFESAHENRIPVSIERGRQVVERLDSWNTWLGN